jgi:hypothetical protein
VRDREGVEEARGSGDRGGGRTWRRAREWRAAERRRAVGAGWVAEAMAAEAAAVGRPSIGLKIVYAVSVCDAIHYCSEDISVFLFPFLKQTTLLHHYYKFYISTT